MLRLIIFNKILSEINVNFDDVEYCFYNIELTIFLFNLLLTYNTINKIVNCFKFKVNKKNF